MTETAGAGWFTRPRPNERPSSGRCRTSSGAGQGGKDEASLEGTGGRQRVDPRPGRRRPGRVRRRPEDKACQASITSGLGRWLRCLLLAVQAGEAEIDTSSGSTAARAPEELKPAGVAPEAPQAERALAALAKSLLVSPDDAAMWGTRVKTKGPDGKLRNSAQLATMLAAVKQGKVQEAVDRLKEDIEIAEAKGMSRENFGVKVIMPWAKDQIPY